MSILGRAVFIVLILAFLIIIFISLNKKTELKLQEITTGWKNLAFKTPEIESLSTHRYSICSNCPENNNGMCMRCACPLLAKTRSPESKCPIGNWQPLNPTLSREQDFLQNPTLLENSSFSLTSPSRTAPPRTKLTAAHFSAQQSTVLYRSPHTEQH